MSSFSNFLFAVLLVVSAFVVLTRCSNAQEIAITFGGDTNFAGSRDTPDPDGIRKWRIFSLDEATAALRPEWDGDINFVNVETVVGPQNGTIQGKQFVFRSHPDQFRYLIDHGVNAFGLANNHSWDHGWAGLRMTWNFFTGEDRADRPLLFSGIGPGDLAYRPRVITVKGARIAMSAVAFGSGAFAPSGDQPGMAYVRDFDRVLAALKATDADIKLLSIHYGIENDISLGWGQADLFRRAVDEAGVNLVIGHHPHVVRAVESRPGANAAIFYSLGNFLFIGGAEKDSKPLGHDYGLMGKAIFNHDGKAMRLTALEAIPFKGVHNIPRRPAPARAAATIEHLNSLSTRSVGDLAARFRIADPSAPRGIACYGGPYGPVARARCCAVERSLHCDLPDLM